jgi:superfamily II DNA or RNA helicase
MSSILYYSKFCEHSNKLLQTLSKTNVQKDIHFICIDKRIKDSNGKMFIVLENEQKIIIDTITNNSNVIVNAVAGSGKTTTLLFIAQKNPHRLRLYGSNKSRFA